MHPTTESWMEPRAQSIDTGRVTTSGDQVFTIVMTNYYDINGFPAGTKDRVTILEFTLT